MEIALTNCKCGYPPKKIKRPINNIGYLIECSCLFCCHSVVGKTKEETIKKWNDANQNQYKIKKEK